MTDDDTPQLSGGIDPLRYVVKVNAIAAVVGLLFFTLAVTFAWAMFRDFVPASRMTPWVWGSGAFLVSWFIIDIVLLVRQPGQAELVRIFGALASYVRITSNLVVLATIWLFLPFAPRELQLVMITFYVAHAATQTLSMPSRGVVNAIGTAVILGSVAAFSFIHGGDYALFIGIFVSVFGAVMMTLSLVLGKLIGNVMAERRRSDETALRLEAALQDVAGERDAKTRFIAAASHDLGQPLQAASLFFDQALRAPDSARRDQAADGVRRAFASADQLLSHMLNHLRLEADAVDPHVSRVGVGPLLARHVAQYQPAAQGVGIALSTVATSAVLRTDRVLLERAVSNLINNAIVHSGAKRIIVGLRTAGAGRVRIWVIDDGVGICAADRARLFEDYFRGSGSRAVSRSGFGLGLSSVRRIATLLGGEAGLDARWQHGSAFYLDFPAVDAPSIKPVRPRPAAKDRQP